MGQVCCTAQAGSPAASKGGPQDDALQSPVSGKVFRLDVDATGKAAEAGAWQLAAQPDAIAAATVPAAPAAAAPPSLRQHGAVDGSGTGSQQRQQPCTGGTRDRRLSLPGAKQSGSTPRSSSDGSDAPGSGSGTATPPPKPAALPPPAFLPRSSPPVALPQPLPQVLSRFLSPVKKVAFTLPPDSKESKGDSATTAAAATTPASGSAAATRPSSATASPYTSPTKQQHQHHHQPQPGASPLSELLWRRPLSPSKQQQLVAVPMADLIHSVASLSRAGKEVTHRKQNQDSCFAFQQYCRPNQALLAALDGHGPHGHAVSAYLKKHVPISLADQLGESGAAAKGGAGNSGGSGGSGAAGATPRCSDVAGALGATFLQVDEALNEDSGINTQYSGSTAVVSMLQGRRLTTAWVGDSKAVLARQDPRGYRAICLTHDHKPTQPQEYARITEQGGRVERLVDHRGQPVGPQRVWLPSAWVPGLAMSRALGDAIAHSVGVTSEPETSVVEVCAQDKFLILATDGVWEFIDPQAAVDIVCECKDAEEACRTLVEAAWSKWLQEEDVVDDITVVCCKFNPC